jgi:2-hydroxychromene-2-carboxylate isomerase
MAATLDFFFFIGSTYTSLSVQRIDAVAAARGVAVRWRPFSVRTLMQEQNNSPFSGKPVKLRYMWRDIERRAARHGLPWAGIPGYPVDLQQLANRVATVAAQEGWCPGFVRACYDDWFLRHLVPGEPAQVRDVLGRLGRDAEAVIARADSEATLAAYAAETGIARAAGIFGSPTFRVGDEIFWGDDRLEDAIDWALR